MIVKNQDGDAIAVSLCEDYFFDEFNENDMSAYPESIRNSLLLFGMIRDSLYQKKLLPDERGKVFSSQMTTVKPEYRNQGVFTSMMSKQEEIAKSQGYEFLVSQSTSNVITDARVKNGFNSVMNMACKHMKIPFVNH